MLFVIKILILTYIILLILYVTKNILNKILKISIKGVSLFNDRQNKRSRTKDSFNGVK